MKHPLLLLLGLLIMLGAGIDDYLSEMKTTTSEVQNFIQDNFGFGTFAYPVACSKIPHARRSAIVQGVGDFARHFTTTDTFRKWYDGYRNNHKPSPPEMTKSMAENRKEQTDALKTQIAELEKASANAPADQKPMYKEMITTMKNAMKEAENPDKSHDAEMDEALKQSNTAAKQEYEEKLAQWEREYPAGNPRPLLKRRLQTFLDATNDVDFNAKLVKKGKVMVFESEEYESKDSNWKLAYRAGKEATQAARAIAQTWMKQL